MSEAMDVDDKGTDPTIDEALYSRQLYVLGTEAMKKMMSSTVLIIGLSGLGVETAKNVILGGVKSVTLHDNSLVKMSDLSAQFFLRHEDVGKPKAAVTCSRLAELNTYVPVEVFSGTLTTEFLTQFGVVVIAGGVPMSQALSINEACRAAGTRFIMSEVSFPLCQQKRAKALSAHAISMFLTPCTHSDDSRPSASSAMPFATSGTNLFVSIRTEKSQPLL